MTAIFKREFRAYFSSPLGYLIIAAMAVFEGIFFVYMFSAGYAENEFVISSTLTVVMLAVPVLTMRLFSEERKQRTDQVLLTSPVSLWGIVAGKFFAALSVFAISYAPTLIFQIILTTKLETLNWLYYIGALFGVLLYGAALIAICMFISSLTESQVVAAVVSLVVSLVLYMIDSFAAMTNVKWIMTLAGHLSFMGRYQPFFAGIINFSSIIFFLSVAFLFVFLTVRVLDKKRWA
ncbi:MAG: ABC transporter permease subunit [Clostridia bacterium]|nr:ABC transporter permease subunit [Clostridia bacterium]